MCNNILLPWLNFIILTATLFVVAWYTFITNRLHRTSQEQLVELTKQRRLSVIPALHPQLLKHGISNKMNLINIGNGVAVNIHFEKIMYAPTKMGDTYYEFENISMLRPMEHVIVPSKSFVLGRIEHSNSELAHLTSEYSDSTVLLHIAFQDLEGERYEEVFQMGKGAHKFISLKLINKSTA